MSALLGIIPFLVEVGLQMSGYQNHALGAFLLILSGIGSIWFIFLIINDWLKSGKNRGRYISLRDAVLGIYDTRRASIEVMMADITSNEPDEILNWLAIFYSDKLPIYGRRFEGSKLELLSYEELKGGQFRRAQEWYEHGLSTHPKYTDLCVKRSDLKGLKKSLGGGS